MLVRLVVSGWPFEPSVIFCKENTATLNFEEVVAHLV